MQSLDSVGSETRFRLASFALGLAAKKLVAAGETSVAEATFMAGVFLSGMNGLAEVGSFSIFTRSVTCRSCFDIKSVGFSDIFRSSVFVLVFLCISV